MIKSGNHTLNVAEAGSRQPVLSAYALTRIYLRMHIETMPVDVFAVVAEPRRRQILDQLRQGPSSVNELVSLLDCPQPTVSKHLKVLRLSGLVTSRTSAQQRIYSLNAASLTELDAWLRPYRELWEHSFTALGRHLEQTQRGPESASEPETASKKEKT
jgi:DNA-binding transcriptional ArsR family regulator